MPYVTLRATIGSEPMHHSARARVGRVETRTVSQRACV
jgi:hypothetical protein